MKCSEDALEAYPRTQDSRCLESKEKDGKTIDFVGVGVYVAMQLVILQIHPDLTGVVFQKIHVWNNIISCDGRGDA